jgi:hypothetical protein
MLDHVNPEESAREYINRGRRREKQSEDRAEEESAAPEPAVPLDKSGTYRSPPIYRGTLRLLRFDE